MASDRKSTSTTEYSNAETNASGFLLHVRTVRAALSSVYGPTHIDHVIGLDQARMAKENNPSHTLGTMGELRSYVSTNGDDKDNFTFCSAWSSLPWIKYPILAIFDGVPSSPQSCLIAKFGDRVIVEMSASSFANRRTSA
jgi:hypothetical protein